MTGYAYDSPKRTQSERIEVLTRRERRRRWSDAEKRQILQETLTPGVSVLMIAKRHGIGTSQIYTWRRQALAGLVGDFVPVMIEAKADLPATPDPLAADPCPPSQPIEIELSGALIRVPPNIGGEILMTVLRAVKAA